MRDHGKSETETLAAGPALAQVAARLRAAVRSEAYDKIPQLLAEHNRRFEQAAREVPNGSAEARLLAVEARETLDWVKASVLANRAHAEASLGRLNSTTRYLPASGPALRTRKLEF